MGWFSRLIERRILKARAEGKLQGLQGEGEPLPDRTGDALSDPGIAAGYRIMAEAGVLPEEFALKKKIEAQKEVLAGVTDPKARKEEMAKLADLEMRKNIAVEARKKFHQG